MGKAPQRLALSRETIRRLSDHEAAGAQGAGASLTCFLLASCPISCYPGGCNTHAQNCVSNIESTCTI
jgi:hypothetical protein